MVKRLAWQTCKKYRFGILKGFKSKLAFTFGEGKPVQMKKKLIGWLCALSPIESISMKEKIQEIFMMTLHEVKESLF